MKRICGLLLALIVVCTMFTLPVSAVTTSYTVGGSRFTSTGFSVSNGVATADTDGATAVWSIDYAGDAFAKLSFKAGSIVSVAITASGISYTKNFTAISDEEIDFGCYTFKAGDKIAVTDVGATTKLSGLNLVPTETTYLNVNDLDTTNTEVFSGWGSSSLKNYDGTKTYNGNGIATWDIPETLSGMTDIYYYYPESPSNAGKGYSDCSVIFEMTDSDGNITTWNFGGLKTPAGWNKVRNADFTETKYKSITIKKGPGANARATAFRFVRNDNPYNSYLITSDNVTAYGSWSEVVSGFDDTIMDNILQSTDIEKPAKGSYDVPDGTYYMYVHSYDNLTYSTATRMFTIKINGTEYKKREQPLEGDTSSRTCYFGTHQYPGTNTGTASDNVEVWEWEKAYMPITVTGGKINFELYPKSTFARTDAILITSNPFITEDMIAGEAGCAVRFEAQSPYSDKIDYPKSYQQLHETVTNTATLTNNNTTVTFKLGELADGNISVQRQIKVGDVETVPYTDGIGFMVIRADSTTKKMPETYYPTFYTKYMADEEEITVNTNNVFRSGVPEWLIPTTLEQVDAKTVKMTATGDMADAVAIWTLEENDKEPKVQVSITVKSDGEYSFGFFNNTTEEKRGNIGYVLNPFRWQETRFPSQGALVSEAFSTTNHTQMTYKQNELGQEITLGVAVDEESVSRDENGKRRWLHNEAVMEKVDNNGESYTIDYSDLQSEFGLNTTGNNKGILPAVFSPLMGSEISTFSANDTYTFTYRPLSTVSTTGKNQGWYDCYSHVAKDLRGVYDYRDNYFASMTDTVFNLIDLIKDEDASGWSDEMLAHYNIEDTHWATTSNGLSYLQNYLLTEDKDFLMERALPSVAFLLTRDSTHINREYSYREQAEGPINKELKFSNISLGNSTFEGAYQLSRGQMPVFRNIAKQRAMNTGIESGGYALKNPSEGLWFDLANGNTSLNTAIEYADKYVNTRSFASVDNKVDEEAFINISYSPHFQSQLDVYEVTGDKKYLDGAIESARRFLPSLRVIDMPIDKNEMYSVDTDLLYNEFKLWNKGTWWWKDGEGYRRGATMKVVEDTTNSSNYVKRVTTGVAEDAVKPDTEEFPFWVASRVGLSLEQFSTCYQRNASIFMSTWAGDVLRLGYLSSDQLMMDLARSSLVGRFSSYPGYYIYTYDDTYGLKNYPTEGFDYTSLYFHHIPVLLSAVQDYLFSNAWVKSDGNVDFPSVRSQGYAWFNNRQYGAEAGTIYSEKNMWPWLKKGAITISGASTYDAQQIDWIAGRKDGRAAFVLTNAGDKDQTVTLTFDSDLLVADNTRATVYDKAGEITYKYVRNNKVEVTVPKKGILTVAVYGDGISAPAHSKVYFPNENDGNDIDMGTSALGLMYDGNTYKSSYDGTSYKGYSTETGYDVKAYALSLDNTAYMGYIFVGGRSADDRVNAENIAVADGEKGIVKTTLTWHYEGEDTVTTVEDTKFPFEFLLPVYEPDKKIMFNVTTEFGSGEVKTLGREYTVAPNMVTEAKHENSSFGPVSTAIITNVGSVAPTLTEGELKLCALDTKYNRTTTFGFDVWEDDALRNCYLNGYLIAKDDASTTDIVESGYILFDNVRIFQSKHLEDKQRLDFTVYGYQMKEKPVAYYDANGKYLGPDQTKVSQQKYYDWSNLYITNSSEKDTDIKISRDGNILTLSCNGAKMATVIVATYDGTRMTDIKMTDVIISINNSKVYEIADNQKLFVWQKTIYNPITMKPLFNAFTND